MQLSFMTTDRSSKIQSNFTWCSLYFAGWGPQSSWLAVFTSLHRDTSFSLWILWWLVSETFKWLTSLSRYPCRSRWGFHCVCSGPLFGTLERYKLSIFLFCIERARFCSFHSQCLSSVLMAETAAMVRVYPANYWWANGQSERSRWLWRWLVNI